MPYSPLSSGVSQTPDKTAVVVPMSLWSSWSEMLLCYSQHYFLNISYRMYKVEKKEDYFQPSPTCTSFYQCFLFHQESNSVNSDCDPVPLKTRRHSWPFIKTNLSCLHDLILFHYFRVLISGFKERHNIKTKWSTKELSSEELSICHCDNTNLIKICLISVCTW